jgi:hypothetical protein
MLPLRFIGKEIERKAQDGEEITALEGDGPIHYQARQTPKTRATDASLIPRATRFLKRELMRESGVHQHALDSFLHTERVHPATRTRLLKVVEKLQREFKRKGTAHAIQKPRR